MVTTQPSSASELPYIHPTAIIDPSAKIGRNVTIGPFTTVGFEAEIGDNSILESNVYIGRWTKLGVGTRIYPFAAVGLDPQDLKYSGEKTSLLAGDHNVFQSHVTVSRGTTKENLKTLIGDNNLFMAYSHIGHDCTVGDKNVFTNGSTLAGHVHVGNSVHIGAFCAVHQFCRVGSFAFISHGAMVTQDVLPFLMVSGNRPRACGLNTIGLKRNGLGGETLLNLQEAYKIIFRSGLMTNVAVERLHSLLQKCAEVGLLIEGISSAKRGFVR